MNVPRVIILEVTSEDILNGCRRSARSCPVAIALQRKFPEADVVCAGFGQAHIECGLQTWQLCGSGRLTKFVTDFDEGSVPEPSTFVLFSEEIQPKVTHG